ncbi:hypothetical protein F5884DRAFT_757670 [Xylogone sp. PMI_703]|nr:hypothetical protein F5884DRAFT_757670 [Xylogone sp. PMI_703]
MGNNFDDSIVKRYCFSNLKVLSCFTESQYREPDLAVKVHLKGGTSLFVHKDILYIEVDAFNLINRFLCGDSIIDTLTENFESFAPHMMTIWRLAVEWEMIPLCEDVLTYTASTSNTETVIEAWNIAHEVLGDESETFRRLQSVLNKITEAPCMMDGKIISSDSASRILLHC